MKESKFFNYFKPDKEFVKKTEGIFLSAFSAKYAKPAALLQPAYAFSYRYFFRGAVVGIAFMVIIGATSTYAYQKDVGPENALYPLKRIQEDVRVALKPEAEKSSFHLELAEKRLKEVEILKDKNVNGGKIEKLTEDLHQEVKKSLIAFVDVGELSRIPSGALESLPTTFSEQSVQGEIEGQIAEPQETAIQAPAIQVPDQKNLPAASPSLAPVAGGIPKTTSIQVVSPNGGEKIPFGPRNFHVKYRLNRFPDEKSFGIGFHLLKDGKYLGQIIPPGGKIYADPQYWNYSWTPGRYFPVAEDWPLNKPISMIRTLTEPGNDYALRIILYYEGKEISRDTSDSAFSIFDDGKFKIELPKTDNKILSPTEPAAPVIKQLPTENLDNLKVEAQPKETIILKKLEKPRLCNAIQKLIENDLPEVKHKLLSDPEIIKHFEEKCLAE